MPRCKLCEAFYEQYPLQERRGNQVHVLSEDRSFSRSFSMTQSPQECAFETGTFSTENFQCGTMNDLRDLAEKLSEDKERLEKGYCRDGYHRREDMDSGSIGVVRIPESDMEFEDDEAVQGYIVMTWYKNRGRTGRAYIMDDDDEVRVLDLKTAEGVLDLYAGRTNDAKS